MSQENVELVKRSFEAFSRGGIEAALSYFDPEVEWSPLLEEFRGHAGIRQVLSEYAMSQENVELVLRAYRAWNERDVDAWVACGTPDIEWRLIGGFADLMGPVFKGHEGLRRFFNEFVVSMESRVEAESILEADHHAGPVVPARRVKHALRAKPLAWK